MRDISSQQQKQGRSIERQTQAGARLFSWEPACMHPARLRTQGRVSCSTLDPNEFTFEGDTLQNPFAGGQDPVLSPCALTLIQTATNLHTQCYWVESRQVWVWGWKNTAQCFPPSLDVLRLTVGELNGVVRTEIPTREKKKSVFCWLFSE